MSLQRAWGPPAPRCPVQEPASDHTARAVPLHCGKRPCTAERTEDRPERQATCICGAVTIADAFTRQRWGDLIGSTPVGPSQRRSGSVEAQALGLVASAVSADVVWMKSVWHPLRDEAPLCS